MDVQEQELRLALLSRLLGRFSPSRAKMWHWRAIYCHFIAVSVFYHQAIGPNSPQRITAMRIWMRAADRPSMLTRWWCCHIEPNLAANTVGSFCSQLSATRSTPVYVCSRPSNLAGRATIRLSSPKLVLWHIMVVGKASYNIPLYKSRTSGLYWKLWPGLHIWCCTIWCEQFLRDNHK